MKAFLREFVRLFCYLMVAVAAGVVWLQWLAGENNQCGEGNATIVQMGRGVMCVPAYKWQPAMTTSSLTSNK